MTNTNVSPRLATIRTRRPWPWAIGWALIPVLFAAIGFGYAQSQQFDDRRTYLATAAAFSEEIWYRGIVMATLRQRSRRTAIVGSAVIFGVLHLANLFGGASPLYAGLQLAFAALFGLVAALVVEHSGSLWPAIAWHFAHDAITYVGGDALNATTLAVLAVEVVVLAAYAGVLWRRLPA